MIAICAASASAEAPITRWTCSKLGDIAATVAYGRDYGVQPYVALKALVDTVDEAKNPRLFNMVVQQVAFTYDHPEFSPFLISASAEAVCVRGLHPSR